MATTTAIQRPAQLSLFPCQGPSVKSTANGSTTSAAKSLTINEYLHTRDALWRLLACYPPTMPVTEALRLARVDFTKGRKEVAL